MRKFFTIFSIILTMPLCYGSHSPVRDPQKRPSVQGIEVLPLPDEIQNALANGSHLGALRQLHESITTKSADTARAAGFPSADYPSLCALLSACDSPIRALDALARSASPVPYPYMSAYGLGTTFQYAPVPEDGEKRAEILESIRSHSKEYLTPEGSQNARNALVVAVRLRDSGGHPLGPVLYMGEFISGGESYVARTQKRDVITVGSLTPHKFIQLPTGSGKMKVLGMEEPEQRARSLMIEHNTVAAQPEGEEVFLCPVLALDGSHLGITRAGCSGVEDRGDGVIKVKMPLITLSSAYQEKQKIEWSDRYYATMKDRVLHFIPDGMTAPVGIFSKLSPQALGILQHSRYADAACRILFNSSAMHIEEEEDGCFSAAFDASFLDSEQAFLQLLENGILSKFLRYEIPDPDSRISINNVAAVEFEFLTQRDICVFCRGTLSSLLGRGCLIKRAAELLDRIPYDLKGGSCRQKDQSLTVKVFAYSLEFAPKDKDQSRGITACTRSSGRA